MAMTQDPIEDGTYHRKKAYFSGNIPPKYGLKNGTFTYLHQLDPGDLPLKKWWILFDPPHGSLKTL